jgi:hypothetical protein
VRLFVICIQWLLRFHYHSAAWLQQCQLLAPLAAIVVTSWHARQTKAVCVVACVACTAQEHVVCIICLLAHSAEGIFIIIPSCSCHAGAVNLLCMPLLQVSVCCLILQKDE